MIARLKALCLHSLTIGWSYCQAAVSFVLINLDALADALGDPALRDNVSDAVGDPRKVGWILLAMSAVTFAARMRSLRLAA